MDADMGLDAFQTAITSRFGVADRARGIPASVAWLTEEVGELAQAVRKGSPDDQARELGDVLAWLASLADQLDLRLADAAQRHLERHRPATDPSG